MSDESLIEKVRALFVQQPAYKPLSTEEIAQAIGVERDLAFLGACSNLYHEGFLARWESVTSTACWYLRVEPLKPVEPALPSEEVLEAARACLRRCAVRFFMPAQARQALLTAELAYTGTMGQLLSALLAEGFLRTSMQGNGETWFELVEKPTEHLAAPEPGEPPPEVPLELIRDFLGPIWYCWAGKPRQCTGEPRTSPRVRAVLRALQETPNADALEMCIGLLRDELEVRRTGARA